MRSRVLAAAFAGLLLAGARLMAHHEILAKFDDHKPVTLNGIVTLVDWRNPHVHVFMNVRGRGGTDQLGDRARRPHRSASTAAGRARHCARAIGSASPAMPPGTAATRRGAIQSWCGRPARASTTSRSTPPAPPLEPRPTPRWPDRQPRLGAAQGGSTGYWAYPSVTALAEGNSAGKIAVPMDTWGLLKNIADAPKVAPMQPWALQLYTERQKRFLQDDPMYLNCKPPGGSRQFQLAYGVQFVEDRDRKRIFVLIGSGNNNYRIINTDGRSHKGQVGGDDENPLYYGRSVGQWEGDTLVVDTRGFNEDFWFTNGGLPHTDQLRLLERFSRPDFDTLKYDVTVEDPGAYTRAWSSSATLRWVAGEEMPRHLCQDNRS